MSNTRKSDTDYGAMTKTIRHYAEGFGASDGFDIRHVAKWNSAQKGSVTRYFNLVKSLSAKPHYIYRPRSRKNLSTVKKSLGVDSYKKLKVGIFQVPNEGAKIKVEVKKDQVKIKTRGVERALLPFEDFGFDATELALNPERVIDSVIDNNDFKYYTIMAGEFETGAWQTGSKGVPQYHKPDAIKKAVIDLMNAYSEEEGYNSADPNSSHHKNWLRGLIGYSFDEIGGFINYNDALIDYRKRKEQIDEKIYRGKTQIKKWEKQIKKVNRTRKVKGSIKSAKIKTINNKIDNKKKDINKLLYQLIKANNN